MAKKISFFFNIIVLFLVLGGPIYSEELTIIPLKKPILDTIDKQKKITQNIIRPKKIWIETIGIIIEIGVYAGNRDIRAMWEDGEIRTATSQKFEIINESR